MTGRTKITLDESEIPRQWYNVIPDLPSPPPPPLHPGTLQPVGPEDLAPLFPMALIAQEVTADSYVPIPDEVLDVYRLRAGPLAPHELANGLAFADAVLVLVLNDNDGIAATPDGMIAAIVSERRAEVHQATGMVAAQLGVSMTDALAALRAHAYAHSRRLSDLATDVLARRVRLGPGSAPPPAPPPPAPPPPAGGDLRHDGNGSPEPGQRRGEED